MKATPKPRLSIILPLALTVSGAGLLAARLQPESVAAWTTYAAATEKRIAGELAVETRFLALDFGPDAAADRRDVLAGQLVIRSAESHDDRGRKIDMPSALVHHWRGAVLIRDVTLDQMLTTLQGDAPVAVRGDVLKASVLSRGPDGLRIFLRLQRKEVVTAVFNTEHLVTYRRASPARATSRSTATRIAEVADAGTPREHELPPGDDRGFLWRLNAYWRYEQVSGGVVAECESISLSRGVPSMFKVFVMPIVNNAAGEAMGATLKALRERFVR